MADVYEMNEEAQRRLAKWLEGRPQKIKDMVAQKPANKLYRLKTTGERGMIYSYSEDGTVTMEFTGQFNLLPIEKRVFGLEMYDIEECDLPLPGEELGTILDEEGQLKYIERMKQEIAEKRGEDPCEHWDGRNIVKVCGTCWEQKQRVIQ